MTNSTPDIWKPSPTRAVHADRPCLLAILNRTPDSFSDGGELDTLERVVRRATTAIEQGADMLDIGGESTRPGAQRIDADEQIRRVVPAIRAIRDAGINCPITIDTTLRRVAESALDAGTDAINDVSAGTEDDGMLTLAGERSCGIILMHRLSPPDKDSFSDQYTSEPAYRDVVNDVLNYLRDRANAAIDRGIDPQSIMLDPGLGFGKSVGQNLALIRGTDRLCTLGFPVFSALSRKSFVGRIALGRDSEPGERVAGSIACSVLHLVAGARFFRVHDVAEHRQSLDAAWAALSAPEVGAD
ncbi:MAG: dihydropteroate synthase [Phycisphaerales bacterium]|nr:dihydropteroate synthase [Phycisphaerales bacterium]